MTCFRETVCMHVYKIGLITEKFNKVFSKISHSKIKSSSGEIVKKYNTGLLKNDFVQSF